MKLSEFSTDEAFDILCELTPYVSNIVTDEELLEELKAAVDLKGASTMAARVAISIQKINKLMPIILKKRKTDVFGILAVLNEKTVEEVAKQSIIATMKQIRDITKDKEFLDFFKSCADSEGSE